MNKKILTFALIFAIGISYSAFALQINVDYARQYTKSSGSILDDTNTFTSSVDVANTISDDMTSTYTRIRNETDDKEVLEVSFYDLNLNDSSYKIKYFVKGAYGDDLRIYAVNNGVVDTSTYFERDDMRSNQWYEDDITDVLKKAVQYNPSNATIRFVVIGDWETTKISEVYLVREIEDISDLQILPMGVSTTNLNQIVENRWRIYANQFFDITNATCGIYDTNNTLISSNVQIQIENRGKDSSLLATWNSDGNVFEDGKSYKVVCSIQIDGKRTIHGVEQYVYITKEKTIFDKIVEILNHVLGIEQNVNATLNLSEEINTTTHLIRQDIMNLNATNNQTFENLTAQISDLKTTMQQEHVDIIANITDTKQNLTNLITNYHNEENDELSNITNTLIAMNQTITDNQADLKNYINETYEYIISFRQENTQYHNDLINLINSLNATNEQRKIEILNFVSSMNDNLTSDLTDIQQQITDLHNYIDTRITETEDLINAVNQSLTQKLDLINSIVQDNGNKIDRNYNAMVVVNNTINSINDDIQILKQNTQDILANQQTILNNLNSIQQQITDLETNMNNKFSQVFEQLNNQTQTILGVNASIQQHLVTIETNQQTHDTSEQQRFAETQQLINSSKGNIISELQQHENDLQAKYNNLMDKLNDLETKINEINATLDVQNMNLTMILNYTYDEYLHNHPELAPLTTQTSVVNNNGVVTFTTEVTDINHDLVNDAICLMNITQGSNIIGSNVEMNNIGDGTYKYTTTLGAGSYEYNVACHR